MRLYARVQYNVNAAETYCFLFHVVYITLYALKRKMKRERPKRRFMHAVREDMTVAEVTEEDAEDRTEWRLTNLCGEREAERRRRSVH